MRIAVDAMGGDRAPEVVIEGVVEALKSSKEHLEIYLTGEQQIIESCLPRTDRVKIVHAPEVIGADESPGATLRKKTNSSIGVAIGLQKEKKVDAFVSAGNTGAIMAFSLFALGRLEGVVRPSLASFFPTLRGYIIVLDVGANTDCKPANLLQFAVMGSIYVQNVLDKSNPKVALLNIGEESTKGNELTQKTYRMLENSGLNFIGNIEGRDILTGEADVIVCDGFVGNVILKFTESLKDLLINYLGIYMRKEPRIRMGASLLSPFFEDFKSKLNYEQYGGAPLLGIDGITIVCHGNSSSEAIRNAIFVANQCAERRINKKIEDKLQALLGSVGETEAGRAQVAKPEQ